MKKEQAPDRITIYHFLENKTDPLVEKGEK